MSNYFDDVQKLTDIGFVQTLSYLGYDILKIEERDSRMCTFHVIIPPKELSELGSQFANGNLPLADAKTFCQTQFALYRKMKTARKKGGEWVDEELRQLARSQGVTI